MFALGFPKTVIVSFLTCIIVAVVKFAIIMPKVQSKKREATTAAATEAPLSDDAWEEHDRLVWEEAPMVRLIRKAETLSGEALAPLERSLDVVRATMEKQETMESALLIVDTLVKLFLIIRMFRDAIKKSLWDDLRTHGIDTLVESLRTAESYTTFTSFQLDQQYESLFLREYLRIPVGTSIVKQSSRQDTASTSICSTSAASEEDDASALVHTGCDDSDDEYLASCMNAGPSKRNGGKISQSFSVRNEEGVFKVWSPGEKSGGITLKVDMWRTRDIAGMPKMEWWRKAMFRGTFHTTALGETHLQMKKMFIKKLKELETPVISFYLGSICWHVT